LAGFVCVIFFEFLKEEQQKIKGRKNFFLLFNNPLISFKNKKKVSLPFFKNCKIKIPIKPFKNPKKNKQENKSSININS